MLIYALLLATLVVTLLERLVYRVMGVRSLSYTANFDTDRATEGDVVHFVEEIQNTSLIPLPWVRIESAFDLYLRFHGQSERRIRLGSQFHQFHYSVFTLSPRTKITRTHDVTCQKRGEYFLRAAAMTVGDLFGFYRRTKEVPLDVRLMVYPRMLMIQELPTPIHHWLGEVMVRRSVVDDPFSISGVRQYEPGDPLRLINWKATAHASSVMVHRRDFTADSQLLIYLNIEDQANMWNKVSHPELIENAITYTASVARYAIDNGMKVGWVTNGSSTGLTQMPVRSGSAHLEQILESLARLQIERSKGFAEMLRDEVRQGVQYHDILLLTTYVDEEIAECIEELRRLQNAVEVVNLYELAGERREFAW